MGRKTEDQIILKILRESQVKGRKESKVSRVRKSKFEGKHICYSSKVQNFLLFPRRKSNP